LLEKARLKNADIVALQFWSAGLRPLWMAVSSLSWGNRKVQCPESKAGRSPALQKSRSGVHECGMRLVWILVAPAFSFAAVRKPSPPSKRESIVAYRPPPAEQRSSRNFRRSAPRSFSTPVARHVAAHPRDDPSECVWRICTGDFDNDGLTDFYVTSPLGGNRLYRNRGDFRFDDVTVSAGVLETNFWARGQRSLISTTMAGWTFTLVGTAYQSALHQQGPGSDGRVRFVEKAREFGLDFNGASMTMAFGDFDRDGDLDAYLATTAIPPPPSLKFGVVYEGGKPVVPKQLQEYWMLLDRPGQQPVPTEAGQFDHFYRNDGGRFTEITAQAGIDGPFFTLSALWWDYNGDGWPDLYVSNDYLGFDKLYRNNRDGTFTDVIRQVIPHTPWSSMATDIGDFNNDGLVDLIATDMIGSTHFRRNVMMGEATKREWFLEYAEPRQYIRNALYLNTGAERMMEFAYQAGLPYTDWTWGPRIEDFDNDGWQDVFVANGMLRDVQNGDLGMYADRTYRPGSPEWSGFWASQARQRKPTWFFGMWAGCILSMPKMRGDLTGWASVSDAPRPISTMMAGWTWW